jgi:ABC-type branched-subunit amino acid transport system substrate-binding protein
MYNSYLTTLAAHNIPNIAPLAVAGALADADSYPIYGGGTIELVGSMAALAGLHKNDVSIVVPSDDISAVASIVAPALKSITQLSSKTTGVAANAVDMSPYVQTAGRDDATAAFLGGSQLTSFIQAFQQQYGGKGKALISAAEEITPQVIKQLGKYADGLYVASAFLPPSDTAVPAVAAFDSAMQALGKSPLIDEVSQDGYSAVQLFAQAVKGISPSAVTGEAIKSKLNRMSNVDLGMSAPVSFQAPFTGPPNPKVARLFNPNIIYDRVEDGRLVIASKGSSPFVNAYTAAPFTAVP